MVFGIEKQRGVLEREREQVKNKNMEEVEKVERSMLCPNRGKRRGRKKREYSPIALAYDLKTRTTRAKRLASALTGPPRRAGTTRRAAGAVAERRCGDTDSGSGVPVLEIGIEFDDVGELQ